MAIVTIPELRTPDPGLIDLDPSGDTGVLVLDAAGEKVAYTFRAPRAGTITRIGFMMGTVTNNQQLRISLQNPAVDGTPDGVQDQFFNQLITANNWYSGNLNVGRVVTLGEVVVMVIEFSGAPGNLQIKTLLSPGGANKAAYQGSTFVSHFTSAWAKQGTMLPRMLITYDDGTVAYIPGAYPIFVSSFYALTTPGERVGFRYKNNAAVRVKGMWARVQIDAVNGGMTFELYDDTDALVRSKVVNVRQSASGNTYVTYVEYFDTPYLIPSNTIIHGQVALTADVLSLSRHGVIEPTALGGMPGGADFWMAQRLGPNSYDNIAQQGWPHAGLIIDGIEEGLAVTAQRIISSSDIYALDVRAKV